MDVNSTPIMPTIKDEIMKVIAAIWRHTSDWKTKLHPCSSNPKKGWSHEVYWL